MLLRLLLVVLCSVAAVPALAQSTMVILSTTTSTQDSGLLDTLVPMFEKKTGLTVKAISVGTGQALALAARGEADVALVHAPSLERKYIEEGKMQNRRLVMYNDFVLIGPEDDPAKIKGLPKAVEALKRIAETPSRFVSRGDKSGTHLLELGLWKQAAFQKRLSLPILVEKDRPLLNIYSVMEINSANGSRVNVAGGKAFADFMVAPETQAVIKTFGGDKYGQPLFVPIAGQSEADFP